MARHLWAKIRVDMRHHPKLLGRSDGDFRLWTGLLLHAKEHCPDGVVRGMSAADMRGAWGIKAPAENVRRALAYFEKSGMLIRQPDDGLLIKDFLEEQRPQKDSPEAALERKRRERERERSVTGPSRVEPPVTSPVTSGVGARDAPRDCARDASVTCHAEEEEEKEEEKDPRSDQGGKIPSRASAEARQGAPPQAWDSLLLAELKAALGKDETDSAFAGFLVSALKFPREQREIATREFLSRGCASEGKGPSYLLAMIRDGAGMKRGASNGSGKLDGKANGNASPVPKWKQQGASSPEEYESWLAEANRA